MSPYLSPGDYLPHDAPMMLLDEVVDVSEETACCRVTVAASGVLTPFLDAQGDLPGWFALELMAQTVGVWSGWHRHQRGETHIALGMVLSARDLRCDESRFPAGTTLTITTTRLMQDARFGSFECTIEAGSHPLASGRINTFQPTTEELHTLFQQGASA
ncbi:3-hydroxy-fatty acyl-ACP dehydratase [Kluyvera genomosp. 1]|uniref:ApeP family dehydratase n=1 Tax=Kluyvera genomosp. 1 TaxID=2774053 RepID=UPI0006923147|nr:3-hydroxy-fatty acyl-ACP dehydratase [Kluyvera genomosp. 1]